MHFFRVSSVGVKIVANAIVGVVLALIVRKQPQNNSTNNFSHFFFPTD